MGRVAGGLHACCAFEHCFDDVVIARTAAQIAVELGADVVAEQASARYEDGILRVEVPLATPDDEVRRVPISEPRGVPPKGIE